MQAVEGRNGAQPSFEPFANSQDPWKAFPDPPAPAEEPPQGASWADFEGASPFQANPTGAHLLHMMPLKMRAQLCVFIQEDCGHGPPKCL